MGNNHETPKAQCPPTGSIKCSPAEQVSRHAPKTISTVLARCTRAGRRRRSRRPDKHSREYLNRATDLRLTTPEADVGAYQSEDEQAVDVEYGGGDAAACPGRRACQREEADDANVGECGCERGREGGKGSAGPGVSWIV
jgi:hypothetical protein